MEILFLLVGVIFIGVGGAIIFYEVKERHGTVPVAARIVGFSTARSKHPNSPSFHSVAEYQATNGRNYYVEGAVGSSVPLHRVGDAVTVLVDPGQPERAIIQSQLSFVIGIVLALFGMTGAFVFWATFRASLYSFVMAAVVCGAFAFKIKKAWRKQPLSFEQWQEYKKQIFSPRVFTEESKNQIAWADPTNLAAAIRYQKRSNRFAIPILVIGGLGLLLLSRHFYVKTEAFLEKADRTSGRVINLQETDSTDASTTYAPVVEYKDADGQSHTFVDSFSSSPPSYRIGDAVGVLYNRDDVKEAQIDRGKRNYWATFLTGSAGVLFCWLGLYSLRRARSV